MQAIYNAVKICVKVYGNLSQYFDIYMGVKKGEPLSPLRFILFINGMSNAVFDEKADIVSFDELQIFLILFADDRFFFSYTEFGLQASLKRLEVYCNKRAKRPWITHLSIQAKSQTFNFEIWVTFDQGQRMTLTFDTHSTSSTH